MTEQPYRQPARIVADTIVTVVRLAGFLTAVVGGLIGAGLPLWAILCIAGVTAMMAASPPSQPSQPKAPS